MKNIKKKFREEKAIWNQTSLQSENLPSLPLSVQYVFAKCQLQGVFSNVPMATTCVKTAIHAWKCVPSVASHLWTGLLIWRSSWEISIHQDSKNIIIIDYMFQVLSTFCLYEIIFTSQSFGSSYFQLLLWQNYISLIIFFLHMEHIRTINPRRTAFFSIFT